MLERHADRAPRLADSFELTRGWRRPYGDLTMGIPGVRTVSILVWALAGGCNVEQGGLGTASAGSAESSSSGAGSTAAEPTSSTSLGTDAESGDTTAGSSTGAPGTGSTEGTTGTSTGTAMPESSSSGEGETGTSVEPGQPYGPCAPGGECMGGNVVCFEDGGLTMCLPPCDGTSPSCPPPPADNTSLVECVEVLGVHCMLNCDAGGDRSCPGESECINIGGGIFRCLWP